MANPVLADRLEPLEKDCDAKFRVVFGAIRELVTPPPSGDRRIGFQLERDDGGRLPRPVRSGPQRYTPYGTGACRDACRRLTGHG